MVSFNLCKPNLSQGKVLFDLFKQTQSLCKISEKAISEFAPDISSLFATMQSNHLILPRFSRSKY